MTRSLTAEMSAALTAPVVQPILLFTAEMVTTTVRFWTGRGELSALGHMYLGSGDLLAMSAVTETDEVKATGVTFTLSGVLPNQITIALAETQNGKPGTVHLGLLTEAGALIPDPKIIFRGRLDTVEIDSSDLAKPLIKLQFESELVDLERPRQWRYSDEDQQKLFPGDRGLEYIPSLIDARINWGRRG